LSNKISNKDKKDWKEFISSSDKLINKDLYLEKKINKNINKTIDLHGFSLNNANKVIDQFIHEGFMSGVNRITVITGKGLRSDNISNPYLSKDLSILKNSVPEFIKSNKSLMRMIKEIKQAKLEEGGSGAFYIYLKKKFK
tara:strand:+ start:247 stop:666 length:420 start_codon:yes stop_codon:yes gene_type:complete